MYLFWLVKLRKKVKIGKRMKHKEKNNKEKPAQAFIRGELFFKRTIDKETKIEKISIKEFIFVSNFQSISDSHYTSSVVGRISEGPISVHGI